MSEEDEDPSDDEARKQRRRAKEKILKGSASMEDIKNGKKSGLDQIEEEKEASIKSGGSKNLDKPQNNLGVVDNSDGKSKSSSRARKYMDAPTVGGGAMVSKEFEQEMTQKFEDVYASLET